MSFLTLEKAAELATATINAANPGTTPVTVKPACISDLIETGALLATGGRPDSADAQELFAATRIIDDLYAPWVRVSVAPLSQSGACDRLPNGQPRKWAGVDLHNTRGLSPAEVQAAYCGVWPVSEHDARAAMIEQAYFLPTIKGFIPGTLIGAVTGYYRDNTTGRRWFTARNLIPTEQEHLFPAGSGYKHLWLTIGAGAVAGVNL